MSKCRTCDGLNRFNTSLQFERTASYDEELECFVHRQKIGRLIIFCSNDPRAIKKSKEVGKRKFRLRSIEVGRAILLNTNGL